MIATDWQEARSLVIYHIISRVRFTLQNCTLTALRGVRGPTAKTKYLSVNEISFNFIPTKSSYEIMR
jgi:hypothetical protein